MAGKVTITVIKGKTRGASYSYAHKELLIAGRKADCAIVLKDPAVSRYHCMLDVNPPSVIVRDFGSLNGTYLNGALIGQRPAGMDAEAASKRTPNEFALHNGDVLGLGDDTELLIAVQEPRCCRICGAELPEGCEREECDACRAEKDATERDIPDAQLTHTRMGAENRRRSAQAPETECPSSYPEGCCQICGKPLPDDLGTRAHVCGECRKDQEKYFQYLLHASKRESGAKAIRGYRSVRELGSGASGHVLLVENEQNGQAYALKIFMPKYHADEYGRLCFQREAMIMAQLDHPNVVRQYQHGSEGDTFFILMEYCRGGGVDAAMQRRARDIGSAARVAPLDVEYAAGIILQVLDGLEYTHNAVVRAELPNGERVERRGIVHRDVKPANILLSDDSLHPTAKLGDFGMAKAFELAGLTDATREDAKLGTVGFMSRLQMLSFRHVKPVADVWSAAATFYYMLTGRIPKDLHSTPDEIYGVVNLPAIPIMQRNPKIPARLARVIDEALVEIDEKGRDTAAYPTAGELKKAIEGAL